MEDLPKEKTTKTGEMIPSAFNWLTPEFQAKRASRLAKSTQKKSN